jgi:hypothetical protein
MKSHLLATALLVLSPTAFGAGLAIDIEIPAIDVAEYHRPYVAVWIEREDSSVAANLAVWYQQQRAKPRPQNRDRKPGDAETTPEPPAANGPGNGGATEGGESGTKWLPDLRQWWRRSGRSLSLPVDGVTGATRPVGTHTLRFDDASALQHLVPGNYRLVVEAAREVGGRELLKLPFAWPVTAAASTEAQGKTELGRIGLSLVP